MISDLRIPSLGACLYMCCTSHKLHCVIHVWQSMAVGRYRLQCRVKSIFLRWVLQSNFIKWIVASKKQISVIFDIQCQCGSFLIPLNTIRSVGYFIHIESLGKWLWQGLQGAHGYQWNYDVLLGHWTHLIKWNPTVLFSFLFGLGLLHNGYRGVEGTPCVPSLFTCFYLEEK